MKARLSRDFILLRVWFPVALLAVALTALLGTASAMADVKPVEVSGYTEDFSVSPAIAEDRLETQELGVAIVEELKENLGGAYSGVWFDNAKGEFVVPLTPQASRLSVSAQLAAAELQGDFRTAPAQSSWSELVAAQDRLDRALIESIADGRVQTSIDPRANAVVIDEAAGLSDADTSEIEALAAGESVEVQVQEDKSRSLGIAPRACNAEWANCDAPMRGGVRIEPSGTPCCIPVCSAGFKATDGAGNRYMLTAGHCVPGVGQWLAYTPDEQPHYLGAVTGASYPGHDYAAIKVTGNGTYWDKPSWPSMVADWGKTQERSITAESWSFMGQYVCHSGASSSRYGASCGSVTNLHVTGGTEAGLIYNLTEFATICSIQGDSGGPVYAGNTALGLFTGDDAETQQEEEEFCKRTGFYSEITEDTTALGVSVAPRVGLPPPPPQPPSPPVPGNYRLAFTANTGSLITIGPGYGVNWGQGMAPGTSPGIARLANGSRIMAFQTNEGRLATIGESGGATYWGVGMAPGTSPSIAGLSGGGFEVAFQTSEGKLASINSGTGSATYWQQGMKPGTSPSIAGLASNKFVIAFQANTGSLISIGPGISTNWGQGMASGTSPAVTALINGSYAMVFQTNKNELASIGPTIGGNYWKQSMMAGTSPSITTLSSGDYMMAFEANTGVLVSMNSTGNGTNWGQGMAGSSSPSISGLASGTYVIAFKTNKNELASIGPGGATYWAQEMAPGTSPSASGG